MQDIPDIDCIRCDLYIEAEQGFCGLIWSANGLLLGVKARAFIILCHVKKSLQRNHFIEAAFKINRQLGQCQIPAL
ncbi:hypothetical protein, partial [Yersinia enterocolitica]|uniref:hypothetical protein n=1 Tax=Yersinia enterocolitica TaxID=630 RepID=UPI003D00CA9A